MGYSEATKSGGAANLHAETWATIGNAGKVAVGNFIPDLVNGATDWVERFAHQDTGSLGRMSPWVDVRNEVAQEAAGDLRNVGGVALMFTPLKGGSSIAANSVEQGSVGAMRRRAFEAADYHGTVGNAVKSKGPLNGQSALDASVQVKTTSPRRIGIDYAAREFVVFDRTINNVYHGHVRSWSELHIDMQRTLIKSGMADKRGNIVGGE